MRRLLVLLMLPALLAALALPASAHRQILTDPDDTPGRLDAKRAAITDRGSGADAGLVFRLGTYERFYKRHLRPRRGFIMFMIKRGPESAWRVEITRKPNGKLRATRVMCHESAGCNYENAKTYPVKRPNKKSVKAKVPLADLSGVGKTVRWMAITLFGQGCDGHCHIDLVPDDGRFARFEL